jgi:hypothetical protein
VYTPQALIPGVCDNLKYEWIFKCDKAIHGVIYDLSDG